MKLLISMIVFLLAAPLFAGGSVGGSTGGAGLMDSLEVMETYVLEPSIVEDLNMRLKEEPLVPLEIDSQIYLMQKIQDRIVDKSLTMEVVSE